MSITSSSSRALLFFRRAFSGVAAAGKEKARQFAAVSAMKKEVELETAKNISGSSLTKDVFWMKDPTTGNWLPETHFDQVEDAVDLRNKFLSKNKKETQVY